MVIFRQLQKYGNSSQFRRLVILIILIRKSTKVKKNFQKLKGNVKKVGSVK